MVGLQIITLILILDIIRKNHSKRLKAIVYNTYGGIEALQLLEVPKPVPKDDEVLVKVHAVSINDWDWEKWMASHCSTV